MERLFVLLKKPPLLAVLAAAVIAVSVYFYFFSRPKLLYETAPAKRGDLTQEVSVTGTIKPVESVDLAFDRSGRITAIYADIGDSVKFGDVLVKMYNEDLYAQLAEASANIKSKQAQLDELKRGSRPEEIQVKEDTVFKSRVAVDEAKKNLTDKLQDAYTKSDDAVRNKSDQLYSNPRSVSPQLVFELANVQSKTDMIWGRMQTESILAAWQSSLNSLSVLGDLDAYSLEAKTNLNSIKNFLDSVALGVNSLTASSNLSQTTIDGWKADIYTARTNVNTAINNLSVAEEKLSAAKSALSLAESELSLIKAGSTQEQITAQEALVESAKAAARNIQSSIEKTILRSPISGMVTKQDAKIGEIVAANASVVSVISEGDFQIESNIAEADIAKVQVGDTAKVTLDAYGSDVIFQAKIIKIDPAETVLEGVATYKATLELLDKNGRIRSGLTANLDIVTETRQGVIFVPYRAVFARNGDKMLRVVDKNNVVTEIVVKTGIRGSDGNIEIISGLSEGDNVVVSMK